MFALEFLTVRKKIRIVPTAVLLSSFIAISNPVCIYASELDDSVPVEEVVEVQAVEEPVVEEPVVEEPVVEEPVVEEPVVEEPVVEEPVVEEPVVEEPVVEEPVVEEPVVEEPVVEEPVVEEPVVEEPVVENTVSVSKNEVLELSNGESLNVSNPEVVYESFDYSQQYSDMITLLGYILGILIFFVVIVLCRYIYKFFNIFF